jgi:hypothetical protein
MLLLLMPEFWQWLAKHLQCRHDFADILLHVAHSALGLNG